jgi:hypothetical protein
MTRLWLLSGQRRPADAVQPDGKTLQIWILTLDHCQSRPAIGTNETL